MERILARLDGLALTGTENAAARFFDRLAFVSVALLAASAPHSIAATQAAWTLGMLACVLRLFFKPRPRFEFTPLHLALVAFFAWSAISAVFSYAPDISIAKLRAVSLLLIFFLTYFVVRGRQAVFFLAFLLIGSTMVNVLWVPVQRLIGRGVEVHGLAPGGPLAMAGIREGDTLLKVNGRKLTSPEGLVAEIDRTGGAKVSAFRPDYWVEAEIGGGDLIPAADAIHSLGAESWKKNRNWRSSGFYSHYTTYAEALQLIASLVMGLLVAAFLRRRTGPRGDAADETQTFVSGRYFDLISRWQVLLVCLLLMSLALLLTVTRASQLAFLISSFFIVVIGAGRKWGLILALVLVPVAIGGLIVLQQTRKVGFFDPNDESIKWRQIVYREGVTLFAQSPRHVLVGVGMDTIKRHWKEWHLFDDGRITTGHFHSTPLQLAVERGLPALIIWLTVLGIYARSLWRGIRSIGDRAGSWLDRGVLLGCLGGTIGFFASGLVHYNLGDGEVANIFYFLMGLGMRVAQLSTTGHAAEYPLTDASEFRLAA